MDKIELIDTNDSIELYIDSSMNLAKTSTECAEFMTKRNNNILLKYMVSGTILFATPTCINTENITLSENIQNLDNYLQSYNDCIELPYNQYLNGVNKIASVSNFRNKDVIKDIISFKTLNNKWDGYGAIPLEVESATNAILLMHLVGDLFTKRLRDFYPNPHGTISFNWENESEETISLEIGNMQMSYYIELNSSEVVYRNNIDINAKEASKLSDFISIL